MPGTPLAYSDYRPIRQGDTGWTPERQKARWYYSPKGKVAISYRKFATLARGKSYEEYARQKKRQGVKKRRYKPRKKQPKKRLPKRVLPKKKRKEKTLAERREERREVRLKRYRADILKDSFAKKLSDDLGYNVDWSEMSDADKTQFWEKYHELVDKSRKPTFREYEDNFGDYFDMDYPEYEDIEYGPTP